jgi:isopenicillin N synthase-like dioxygenase
MSGSKINLTEPNVWPSRPVFKERCGKLHSELQALSAQLLSLIAVALGKPSTFFDHYLPNSLSTLRLLHYPPMPANRRQELICTPHTDSGIMTLLHQDSTGGLEVVNAAGQWIPVPYIPGSVVVNIGDLMSRVSSGRYVATLHRVRAGQPGANKDGNRGRYSVPFFLEPGAGCVVKSVNDDDKGVIYGEHLLNKLSKWVEFNDEEEEKPERNLEAPSVMIKAF